MVAKRQRLSAGNVTISTVAARAAVSTMTVSRVINNVGSVDPATRDRVKAAIRELHYAPNASAQRLAAARGAKIALIYDNPSTGFMSEFLIGALDESSRNGSQLIVLKHQDDIAPASLIDAVIGSGAEGVVLPPPLSESDQILQRMLEAGLVTVAVGRGWPHSGVSTVRIDNESGAREIADHLLALGHRRFGYIAGHPNQSVSEQRRFGFFDQLGKAGVAESEIRQEQGYFSYRSGIEAAHRLLSTPDRPTAIFAANDDMAAAVVSVAHRLRLEVPNDLSVVGFDDTALAAEISPSLTTVRQPVTKMATTAAALLATELRSKSRRTEHFEQVLEDHELIVRESTGPAPRTIRPPQTDGRASNPAAKEY